MSDWKPSDLEAAAWCGLAAAFGTLARRGVLPSKQVQRLVGWRRWRHALSGCCLAAGAAAGASLLTSDYLAAQTRLGLMLIVSVCWDLTTSEGLAYMAALVMPKIIAAAKRAEEDQADTQRAIEARKRARDNGEP